MTARRRSSARNASRHEFLADVEVSRLRPVHPGRGRVRRKREMFLLRARHADPAEPQTRGRDAEPDAGSPESRREVKPIPPVEAAELADDSIRGEALDRLRARYGEARELMSPSGDCVNLEWILGAMTDSDERSEDLNRKMMILLSLWLEDLAVELERGTAKGLTEPMSESAAAAHRACETVAASLRQATTAFVMNSRSAD
jgi:hypothetical protein